jgi:redox-sensing transcriptional repressor
LHNQKNCGKFSTSIEGGNMTNHQIPEIVVGRLPQYLRSLQRMAREGRQITSSQELGERLSISAAQIRKDLSQFGEFGKQGTGYHIAYLIEQLQKILNVDHEWDLVVVGAGELGNAVVRYKGFTGRGFKVCMVFDIDPEKIGSQIDGFMIQDFAFMVDKIRAAGIKLAVITVPTNQAQEVADKLVESGVKAILSYAPISINVPEGVRLQYIDPAIHLQRMTFFMD